MAGTPTDLVNRALDAAGVAMEIGDIEDGTENSRKALRHYIPVLEQLSRAAHWNFARKQAPLNLLADASGQTAGVGTVVPQGWLYEYELPTDCLKVRFIPATPTPGVGSNSANGNITLPATPIMTGLTTLPAQVSPIVPTRFLVTTDTNYPGVDPNQPGAGQWWLTRGIAPGARTVILSNQQNAQAVYTCCQIYPNLWDPLFEGAFVAALAEKYALPLNADKKFGMAMRAQNMAVAMEAIKQARIADGNEMWVTTDHTPDFIRARSAGAYRGWLWGLPSSGMDGAWGGGWDTYGFSNGSAY